MQDATAGGLQYHYDIIINYKTDISKNRWERDKITLWQADFFINKYIKYKTLFFQNVGYNDYISIPA